ncbi:hypothetical protein TGDOM2_401030 [Toxoplasma gondii GAB2-2007-GAL-DOM2]|uniref:Uncharacterized protein n=1 Tax=Toxoplasma gondii GAB2-2007-GAL-DOM2 TaxID=1130820 RepID=A0A086JIN1_TOXGO|nr:hypothetical protein TGDOM2_401030 [Toxoplasma gondii GAB2-2007-GAL-DOM2]
MWTRESRNDARRRNFVLVSRALQRQSSVLSTQEGLGQTPRTALARGARTSESLSLACSPRLALRKGISISFVAERPSDRQVTSWTVLPFFPPSLSLLQSSSCILLLCACSPRRPDCCVEACWSTGVLL